MRLADQPAEYLARIAWVRDAALGGRAIPRRDVALRDRTPERICGIDDVCPSFDSGEQAFKTRSEAGASRRREDRHGHRARAANGIRREFLANTADGAAALRSESCDARISKLSLAGIALRSCVQDSCGTRTSVAPTR
jgi:hypothetical protein